MKINIEDVKVSVKIINDPAVNEKAIVNLMIDQLKIKGFRIKTSQFTNKYGEKLWITPPSYKSKGKWCDTFFCEDKKVISLNP